MHYLRSIGRTLTRYFDFAGRADRREYLTFFTFNLLLSGLLAGLYWLTGVTLFRFLGTFLGLALLLPGMAVTVRRLHDTGRSGWWLWLGVTGVGAVVVAWWVVGRSVGDSVVGGRR